MEKLYKCKAQGGGLLKPDSNKDFSSVDWVRLESRSAGGAPAIVLSSRLIRKRRQLPLMTIVWKSDPGTGAFNMHKVQHGLSRFDRAQKKLVFYRHAPHVVVLRSPGKALLTVRNSKLLTMNRQSETVVALSCLTYDHMIRLSSS